MRSGPPGKDGNSLSLFLGWGLGRRVWGSRAEGLGFRVWGLGL